MALDPKLQKFSTASPVLANFSFEEIASGLQFVSFLGIASTDDSGIEYHLITNSGMFSQPIGTSQPATGTKEVNFNTATFNLPRTAKGIAYFSMGVGGTGSGTVSLSVQLIHLDSGDSETTISSEIVSGIITPGGASVGDMIFLQIPITTEKLFAKGEKLRLQVKLNKISGSGSITMGHDPQNQENVGYDPANGGSSVMRLDIPFRLDA